MNTIIFSPFRISYDRSFCGFALLLFLSTALLCQTQDQRAKYDSLQRVYREALRWEKDLKAISDAAYFYRFSSHKSGGGQGSYIGFSLRKEFDSTEFGRYSIYELFPEKIVIQANFFTKKTPMLCIIDSNAIYRGTVQGFQYELEKIGALAVSYRSRSAADSGGGGSYIGFTIPPRYEWTEFGRYYISKVQPDQITINVKSSTERVATSMTFTSKGKKQSPFDYEDDVKSIAAAAVRFRSLPTSQGGGGGSYLGFRIPDNLDTTENGTFWIHDLQQDELVLKVKPVTLTYNYVYVFDSTGKKKQDEYRQRTSGDSFFRNDQAITAEMKMIARYASEYRLRAQQNGEFLNSYKGFTIPEELRSTTNAAYTITEIKNDTIYVRAVSSIGSGTKYYFIYGSGLIHYLVYGEYRPPKEFPPQQSLENARSAYAAADAQLNETYTRLLAAKKSDALFIKNLRNSERIWIQYRDAQIKERFPKKDAQADAAGFTAAHYSFLTSVTESRIKELQQLFTSP